MKRLLITLALPLFLAACGSDDDATLEESGPIVLDFGDTYEATLEIGQVSDASADIQITITAKDESSTEGFAVNLTPNMAMTSGHDHSTPMASESGVLDANGQFNTKAYFLMPSSMNDQLLGNWSFEVTFDDGSEVRTSIAAFTVEMNMADRKTLNGVEDKIYSMTASSGDTPRPYYLYKEARHMDSFTVFVAAREHMTKHTALISGIDLSGKMTMPMPMMAMEMPETPDFTLENIQVSVEMCSSEDCDSNELSWQPASPVHNQAGQYQATGLSHTAEVHVRLTVNSDTINENKVTINEHQQTVDYATFGHSESSGHSDMMDH